MAPFIVVDLAILPRFSLLGKDFITKYRLPRSEFLMVQPSQPRLNGLKHLMVNSLVGGVEIRQLQMVPRPAVGPVAGGVKNMVQLLRGPEVMGEPT
jgi:hypothetical protein